MVESLGRNKATVKTLFFLTALLNVCVWLLAGQGENAFLQIDSEEYLHLANRLFVNHDFPSFFRTPVFPAFLGFWREFLGLSISQIVLVQIALSMLNIYLLGRLVGYVVSVKTKLIIMTVMALDLVTVQVTHYILSETLFSTLLLLGLNFLVMMRFLRSKSLFAFVGLASACGVCLGLFALCRPVGQYLPYLLAVYLFVAIKKRNAYQAFIGALLIILISNATLSAWKWRNEQLTGDSFISITQSINMYNYRAAWNVAWKEGRSFIDVKNEFHKKRDEFVRANPDLRPYQVAQHFTKEGLMIILNTPYETACQAVRGMAFLYGGIYNGSIVRIFGDGFLAKFVKVYSYVYLFLLYLGVLFSLLYFKKLSGQQKSVLLLAAIVVGYFTLLSIGVESYARLRAPFMPYLVLASVLGWRIFYQPKQLNRELLDE